MARIEEGPESKLRHIHAQRKTEPFGSSAWHVVPA